MYKALLCWRYLRTRFLAFVCIVSVMLGVATMIVVNSVMAGFAEKMQTRLHGVLSDVIVESMDMDGTTTMVCSSWLKAWMDFQSGTSFACKLSNWAAACCGVRPEFGNGKSA